MKKQTGVQRVRKNVPGGLVNSTLLCLLQAPNPVDRSHRVATTWQGNMRGSAQRSTARLQPLCCPAWKPTKPQIPTNDGLDTGSLSPILHGYLPIAPQRRSESGSRASNAYSYDAPSTKTTDKMPASPETQCYNICCSPKRVHQFYGFPADVNLGHEISLG